MSNYHLCCQHKGKVVHIYEKTGKVHYGKIVEVDQEFVWIDTRVSSSESPRGFGYGYPGYGGFSGFGGGYGGGYGGYGGYGAYGYGRRPWLFPVALAAIGGFALGAAFFW